MSEKKGAVVMPEIAAWVAELRVALGTDLVDGAIAAGQQARREFKRLEAEQGARAAHAWLKRQRFPNGCFWASERGHEVGINPDTPCS